MTRFTRKLQGRMNEDGFTLIELLIVIVVLGILAGIVVFGVGTFKADAIAACQEANLKTIGVASAAYNAKNGTTGTQSVTTLQSTAGGGPYIDPGFDEDCS